MEKEKYIFFYVVENILRCKEFKYRGNGKTQIDFSLSPYWVINHVDFIYSAGSV